MLDDNYRLLFGPYARRVRARFPGGPPLLDREARHRMLAVLDSRATAVEGLDPAGEAAFAAAFDAPYARVAPVFRRLGARPLPRRGYVRLVARLLADPKAARALTHFASLSPRRLAIADALPVELVRPRFLTLVPDVEEARSLAHALDAAEALGATRRGLAQALLRSRSRRDVRERLRRGLAPPAFPAPPWPGDDRLTPVTAVADVKRLGQEFENCMRRMADGWALARDTVIYRYDGRVRAVCAIERDDPLGWRLDDIRGKENAAVSAAVRADITARFAAAGIRTGQPLRAIIEHWG